MANPFKSGDGGGSGGGGIMQPGETRTLFARAKDGVTVIKTYTLHRTNRPYVEDLCDAYNDELTDPSLRWVVTPGGELKLTHGLVWSRENLKANKQAMEADRRAFNARIADTRRDAG